MTNKDYVLWNLQEAQEELLNIIKNLETNEYEENLSLEVEITHLYHHINTAWNARNASEKQASDCSDEDFNKWRQFPKDIHLEE